MSAPPVTGEVWSVTKLTQHIQVLFSRHIPPLWVEGEISNYSKSSAGHRYFTLKDERNQIRAALFRNHAGALKFEPGNGQTVLVFGSVEAYGARSEYQIITQRVIPTGIGELELAFKQLHARLQKEGLFDESRKRPLPRFPRRIGLVTSAQGAAVRDILKILKRRAPQVDVVIAPVAVQGEGAGVAIAGAIARFNRGRNADVLIVGRGGGSLEDLWAFNEEQTVRAVAASDIPIISAVGHEIDVTLCDLAADMRAPTPSAAAEIVVQDRRELVGVVRDFYRRAYAAATFLLNDGLKHLRHTTRRYGFRKTQDLLLTFTQTLDLLGGRMRRAGVSAVHDLRMAADRLQKRPSLTRPTIWLSSHQDRWARIDSRFDGAWHARLATTQERVTRAGAMLDALSPKAVLERGYAIIIDEDSRIVKSTQQTSAGMPLTAWLSDGKLKVRVEQKETGRPWS
jgi:exodeoxyribonuclease VII large subunit